MKTLAQTARILELNRLKRAAAVDIVNIKATVKQVLEFLFEKYPDIMDGLVYTSNYNFDPNTNVVSFTLHLDKDKAQIVAKNKVQRDTLIKGNVSTELKKVYQRDLGLNYTEDLV